MTRRIGRREREASPTKVLENSCPASTPDRSLIVVPELPASSGPSGERSCPKPRPSRVRVPAGPSSIDTPSRRRQFRVDRQSAPGAKLCSREGPWASAAKSAYRCAIDLSPGTFTRPRRQRAGLTVAAGERDISDGSYATDGILGPPDASMTPNGHQVIRLEFTSAFEMLDFVQVVSDHLARRVGLDEDAMHWVSVAIRESVINAIKHGNRNDSTKRVFVEFGTSMGEVPELSIRVRDQGEGFDPELVANPLDPENLLKSSGRGIFLIRNFMDDVQLRRAPEGGMEIRMVKRAHPADDSEPA